MVCDDSQIETDCGFCQIGYEPPLGYISEHEYVSAVEHAQITKKEISEGVHGRDIKYQHFNYILKIDDIFETKEDAEKRLLEKIEEEKKKEFERLIFNKDNTSKSYSWHVGYYLKKKKDALREIEKYDRKIAHFNPKVKKKPLDTNYKSDIL